MSKTVEVISKLRQGIDSMLTFIQQNKSDAMAEGAGRELALVMTKLEEARMWAGKGLQHFNTGHKETDKAEQPESFTKELTDVIELGPQTTADKVEPTPTEVKPQP